MPTVEPPLARELYEFGPFRVDPDKALLLRGDVPVSLTPKAFQILLVLIRHGQEVVSKDDLLKTVWPDTFVEEGNLTRNVFLLRKALQETPQDRFIVTVPGRGYRLAEPVRVVLASSPEQTLVAPEPHTGVPAVEAPLEIAVAAHSRTRVHVELQRRGTWRTLAVAGLIAAVVFGIGAYRWSRPPASRLANTDTIVLAEFSNSTGDPVFDGALRQGLALGLQQSPMLEIVSDQRINQVLQLMRRPAGTPLTGDVAREACERAGAAAFLEGSIATLGSRYVIGLETRACATGAVLDTEQAQASTKEEVLTALGDVVGRFRSRVGESLASVQQHSTRLDEATTASLEALRAYTAGWQAHAAGGASASMPFFQRAIELDPGFAMAHAALGRVYADLDQSEMAAASMQRAWELRDRASDPERYYLTASYQTLVTGNIDAAQQTCEAWARAYPRDPRPHMVLAGMIHKTAGRFEAALAESQKAVEGDPDLAIGYYSVGVNNQYLGRLEEADRALRVAADRGLDIDEFVMLGYELAFLKNDTAQRDREVARARARAGGENWMSAREACVAAYAGHLRAARALSDRAVAQASQAGQRERAALWQAGAAVREALVGEKGEAERRASAALDLSRTRETEYGAALAFSMVGDAARARPLVDDLERRFPEDTSIRFSALPVLHAELALNAGKPDEALAILQVASPHELGMPRSAISGLFGALYPVYVRGQAYIALGRGAEAVAEFKKIVDHRTIVATDLIGALAHLQLGRSHARAGDRASALEAYRTFLGLWQDADPDIPVVAQAQAECDRLARAAH